MNGNNYVRSTEIFGILPLSSHLRESLSILPYHYQFALDRKIRHSYLAVRQQTRAAVLPIHTRPERSLFKAMLADPQGPFSGRKEPNWIELANIWSGHVDGVLIFYKVCICGLHRRSVYLIYLTQASGTPEKPLEDME